MKTYTIEELQALPDADLNALAAELRGWHVAFGAVDTLAGETVREHHWEGRDNKGELGAIISLLDWQPATDGNQSRELLEWFVETQWKGHYMIRSGKLFRSIHVTAETLGDDVEVGVNDTGAKAETVAFCAAMHALQNAQGGASE